MEKYLRQNEKLQKYCAEFCVGKYESVNASHCQFERDLKWKEKKLNL
jgi:hypothetical protein